MSPQSTDLVGLGMSPQRAAALGNQPSAVTGVGTAQVGGATILTHLATVTASGGATAVVLPLAALVGTPYYVFNSSGTTALVYCPLGHLMNTVLNDKVSVLTHKLAVCIQVSRGVWTSINSA